MVLFQFHKVNIILAFILLSIISFGCREDRLPGKYVYNGDIKPEDHGHLADKKIYIDPGHGGKGKSDAFRVAPNGITEEEINLSVSLILSDMLSRAGVDVVMSRTKDEDITLKQRAEMVRAASPDILVSVHHNGTRRAADGVNYPLVFIRGSAGISPVSFDMAEALLAEFEKLLGVSGQVVSDFAVFNETGTMLLRETYDVCPGIIGEAGFFSDDRFCEKLADRDFNQREAEAYFRAISLYFIKGMPSAVIAYNGGRKSGGPAYVIKTDTGIKDSRIMPGSMKVTINDVPVSFVKRGEGKYLVDPGGRIYPGEHRLNISFKNIEGHSSPLYFFRFSRMIKKGDYDRLNSEGGNLISRRNTAAEGLKMLTAAFSMNPTGIEAPGLLRNISRGFEVLGLNKTSRYYLESASTFFPNANGRKRTSLMGSESNYFPVRYYGIKIPVVPFSKI